MTDKDIQDAIENCHWKTDNRQLNLAKGVCIALCIPCAKGVAAGQCPTLIELFAKERKNDTNS